MSDARKQRLAEFVAWAAEQVTGDEKGEAQIYLDRLFQAFGQKGCLDVGGTTEFRVRKAAQDGGGTAFADYVWKPIVLIEMKKKGEKLSKHFRQAFDYWVRLVPNRPRYTVLCKRMSPEAKEFSMRLMELTRGALVDRTFRYG